MCSWKRSSGCVTLKYYEITVMEWWWNWCGDGVQAAELELGSVVGPGPRSATAGVRAQARTRLRRVRVVRGSVACSERRGRPHRSVEHKPAMPGPRLSRAAWQHGLPDRHHRTQPRSDDGMHLWPNITSANSLGPRGTFRNLGTTRRCSRSVTVFPASTLGRRGSVGAEVRLDSIVCRPRE